MGHGQPVYNAQVASLPSSEQMLSASEALSPPSGALLGLAAAIGPTIAFCSAYLASKRDLPQSIFKRSAKPPEDSLIFSLPPEG